MELSDQELVHPGSPGSSDTFGEPELFPRIGDKYQAAIPDMLTPSERLNYFGDPVDSHPTVQVPHRFLVGSHVCVTWVRSETTIKDKPSDVPDFVTDSKIKPRQHVRENSSSSNEKEPDVTDVYAAVPGLPADTWSEFEADCFLLGLYFFGKNLLQVERFMEGKEMGQLLSFYYGEFFKSAKYQRWANCRKVRGKKCIIGQRLLTGSRQQELFSRLLPGLPEESKNTLEATYKEFEDDGISVEDYVSTLKRVVGIQALVDAVGIGKVNKDLTAMTMDSVRTNQTLPSRPEMPNGKACSSLTHKEIIEYLTGDFRLSKAKSNDLFWEAVWPRLLAKGWHSEKPKDDSYRVFKNSLVFLMPGIKKFRRKLLRGDHYFDSVSDVLKKVASNPELILLENDESGTKYCAKENACGTGPNSDEDGASNQDQSRYLKPRFASEAASTMKFTIVDTSLLHVQNSSKVRELRNLTVEMNSSKSVRRPKQAQEEECDLSEKIKNFIVCNNKKFNKRTECNSMNTPPKPVRNHNDCNNVEHQLVCSQSERAEPVVKRRRLTACSKADSKSMVARLPRPSVVRLDNCVLSLPVPSKKTDHKSSLATDPLQGSNCSSTLPVPSKKTDHKSSLATDPLQGSNCSSTSSETHVRSHPSIDLNAPQALAEPKIVEQAVETKVEEDIVSNKVMNAPLDSSEAAGGSTNDSFFSDERNNGNTIRQSKRNRPMSTKALEALESSFFNPKQGKKRLPADEKPRASRRPRTKRATPGNCTVDAARESEAMRSDGIRNTTTDMLSDALT